MNDKGGKITLASSTVKMSFMRGRARVEVMQFDVEEAAFKEDVGRNLFGISGEYSRKQFCVVWRSLYKWVPTEEVTARQGETREPAADNNTVVQSVETGVPNVLSGQDLAMDMSRDTPQPIDHVDLSQRVSPIVVKRLF
jgi:hypothetical protein